MESIDYSWDEKDAGQITFDNEYHEEVNEEALPNRNNLQLARRLFHMGNGVVVATLYMVSMTHMQMIHFLGTLLCLLYILEQIRINYPEFARRFIPISRFIIRAEEQLKESAMMPYAIAVLLTIITFPKPMALVAIYTLAIADPLSAIIGIKFGKRRLVSHKSLEGSAAFFVSTFVCALGVLSGFSPDSFGIIVLISLLIAFFSSGFEMIPWKIDDNLTIPLFTASMLWILCASFGLNY